MSGEQNIAGLLGTAMEKLGNMVQVNTVIGQPIFAGDTTIIPISKVSLGFVAGGGEYGNKDKTLPTEPAFGGGPGGGLSVAPVGFLTSAPNGQLRYIPVCGQEPLEKLVDMTPGLLTKLEDIFKQNKPKKDHSCPACAESTQP